MKLLVIAYFFPPHGGGGVLRTAETVRLLAARGWEITVVAGPGDGWWVQDDSLSARIPESVRVIRPPNTGLSSLFGVFRRSEDGQRSEGGVRWLKRLMAWLPVVDAYSSWARSVVRLVLESGIHPDWILSSSPPESSHVAATRLAGQLGARWAADFRDPWATGIYRQMPTVLHRRWYQGQECKVVENADLVISTTEETAKDLHNRYPEQLREKIICLTNGFDPAEFDQVASREKKNRLPLKLIHAGNLTLDRDITPLLEAISRINRDGVLCRLLLAGQVAAGIKKQVGAMGLEKAVTFSGYISRPELLAKLAESHAGVLVEAFRPGAGLVVPGKLYDYLGASLPVVALVPDGAAARLIERTGSGVSATEPDPMRLENLLRQLIENLRRGNPALRPPDPQRTEQYQRPRIVNTLAGLLEKDC